MRSWSVLPSDDGCVHVHTRLTVWRLPGDDDRAHEQQQQLREADLRADDAIPSAAARATASSLGRAPLAAAAARRAPSSARQARR